MPANIEKQSIYMKPVMATARDEVGVLGMHEERMKLSGLQNNFARLASS